MNTAFKEFYYPFDAFTLQEDGTLIPHLDEAGNPDRLYNSKDHARERRMIFTDGVFTNRFDGLKVDSVDGNMYITLRQGSAYIKGYSYELYSEDMKVLIPSAHASLPRKDIVVLTLDPGGERKIYARLKKGVPATNPLEPELTRDADTYELKLAVIYIGNGEQVVRPADILDTRLDNEVCGVVTQCVPASLTTTDIFDQYYDFLQKKIAEWEAIQATKQAEYNQLFKDLRNMYLLLETQSFLLINHNFDDLSKFRGCKFTTSFGTDGMITETITGFADTLITIATRTTEFINNGEFVFTETIFVPWSVIEGSVTYKTQAFTLSVLIEFKADGSIIEEVF